MSYDCRLVPKIFINSEIIGYWKNKTVGQTLGWVTLGKFEISACDGDDITTKKEEVGAISQKLFGICITIQFMYN